MNAHHGIQMESIPREIAALWRQSGIRVQGHGIAYAIQAYRTTNQDLPIRIKNNFRPIDSHWQIVAIRSGEMKLTTTEESLKLFADDVILIPPGKALRYQANNKKCVYTHVLFSH